MVARVLPLVVAVALSTTVVTRSAGLQPRDAPAGQTHVDRAFDDFWKADDAKGAERAAERIVKAGVEFDTAYARLKAGRVYAKEKTGEFSMRFPAAAGVLFDNLIEVPAEYTPARPWQLRVQLHGGVNRRTQATVGGPSLEEDESSSRGRAPEVTRRRQENRIRGESQIYAFPSGSASAAWWHANQVDNILRLVDRLKRRYNIDESRIYLTGISDGGTGTYYIVPAAQGQHHRARQSRNQRRWRAVCRQSRQSALLYRERRPRSALPGGPHCDPR